MNSSIYLFLANAGEVQSSPAFAMYPYANIAANVRRKKKKPPLWEALAKQRLSETKVAMKSFTHTS